MFCFRLADRYKDKLSPKVVKCYFLGFAEGQKGYKCYDPVGKRVWVSRHVVF